jgi:hypothetical protein
MRRIIHPQGKADAPFLDGQFANPSQLDKILSSYGIGDSSEGVEDGGKGWSRHRVGDSVRW